MPKAAARTSQPAADDDDPFLDFFRNAPVDPEPETAEQRRLVAEGERRPKRSHGAILRDIEARSKRPNGSA